MTGTKFNTFTLSGVALLLALTLAPAVAQETEFNIEAQPLAKALLEFNEQSGLTVAARRDIVADKTAPAVHGEMEPEAALERILSGTDLKLTQLSSGGYTITVDAADLGKYRSGRSPVPMARNQIVAAQGQTAASRSEATRSGRSDERGVGIVTGKVTDARTGANLKGAKVTIEETGQWTSTNDLGEFRFVNVPTGSATLTVSYLGYAGQSAVVGVRGDGTSQNFALRGGSEIDEIVVFGQRSARALALNQERTADNSSTVITSDLLGNFEGETVSEALRRVPGVAFVENQETGAGQNIVIRGVNSDLNAVKLDGIELPVGSGTGRSATLDNLLADSVSKITINKTLLPSQDSAGTGGLVEIETKSPLDREDNFFRVGAEYGTSGDFGDDWLFSGVASKKFGASENFGISVSAQYRNTNVQQFSTSRSVREGLFLPLQVDGSTSINSLFFVDPRLEFPFEANGDRVFATALNRSQADSEIENLTSGLNVEWQVAGHTHLQLDITNIDQETTSFTPSNQLVASVRYSPQPVEALGGEIRQALIFRNILQDARTYLFRPESESNTFLVNLRGESNFDALTVNYNVGYTDGNSSADSFSFRTRALLRTDDTYFSSEAIDQVEGRIITPFGDRVRSGQYDAFLSQVALGEINDPASHRIAGGAFQQVSGQSERLDIGLSARYELTSPILRELEAGVQFELSRFENDFFNSNLVGRPTLADLGLTNFQSLEENDVGLNLPAILGISRADARAFVGGISDDPNDLVYFPEPDQNVLENQTFTRENEFAPYLQVKLGRGPFEVVGGARLSIIKVSANSLNDVQVFDENFILQEDLRNSLSGIFEESVTQTRVLPRLVVNYRPTENIVFRAGYFRSVARPQIELLTSTQITQLFLAPSFGPNVDQPALFVIKGNPDLKPAESDNFDFSTEYYDEDIGAFKAAVFYKRIKNLLETTTQPFDEGLQALPDGVGLPDDPVFANLPPNLFLGFGQPTNNPDTAKIWGVELSAEKQFTDLPGALGGFGIYANYTFSDSEKTQISTWPSPILDGDDAITGFDQVAEEIKVPFDQQPKHSGTAALTYNEYNIDATISYTYQSRRISIWRPHNLSNYRNKRDSLDMRIEYRFDLGGYQWRAYVEGSDLLKGTSDPALQSSRGGVGSTPEIILSERYLGGRSFRFGLTTSF